MVPKKNLIKDIYFLWRQCKALLRDTEELTERYSTFTNKKAKFLSRLIYRFSTIEIQIANGLFTKLDKLILNFFEEETAKKIILKNLRG